MPKDKDTTRIANVATRKILRAGDDDKCQPRWLDDDDDEEGDGWCGNDARIFRRFVLNGS